MKWLEIDSWSTSHACFYEIPIDINFSDPSYPSLSSIASIPLGNNFIRPIPQDGEAYVSEYNTELERLVIEGKNTWFTAPWLYAEYASLRFYPMIGPLTLLLDVTCTSERLSHVRAHIYSNDLVSSHTAIA